MITARGLARSFGAVDAVQGIDIDVAEGELVAFLGPNGAGKSTTLRMLTTLLAPTAGTATVAGFDIAKDPAAVRRNIGYVGQGNGASYQMRVRDELIDQGRAYGMTKRDAQRRTDELIDALELAALADRKVQTLSGGQRRRLDVALGLVHAPQLLFLDEPSTGLDPQSRANLWTHVQRLREEHGMTIFLTTHYLEEADTMAERVMVMDHGKVIADDTAPRLKASLGDRIAVTVDDPEAASRIAVEVPDILSSEISGAGVTMRTTDGPGTLPAVIRALDVAGVGVRSATAIQPTLDDVFLSLTGRSLRESEQAVPATDDQTEEN